MRMCVDKPRKDKLAPRIDHPIRFVNRENLVTLADRSNLIRFDRERAVAKNSSISIDSNEPFSMCDNKRGHNLFLRKLASEEPIDARALPGARDFPPLSGFPSPQPLRP